MEALKRNALTSAAIARSQWVLKRASTEVRPGVAGEVQCYSRVWVVWVLDRDWYADRSCERSAYEDFVEVVELAVDQTTSE